MKLRSGFSCTAVFLCVALLAISCVRGEYEDQTAVRDFENPGGDGPEVVFNPGADPIPLLPQPNNLLAKDDETTSTGLRVNITYEGKTDFNLFLRQHIRDMDGFANFSNIAVPFSLPIDLKTIRDDTIYVVNVQRDSKFYGEIVPLDLGKGYFPKDLRSPESMFPNDPMAQAKDFIYPPDNRVDHYEDSTNTLLIRPLYPLHQQNKYAVVLTTGLRGENEFPVRPPDYFDSITFPEQEESLSDAAAILREKIGLDPEDIAFSWEFTVMTITEPLEYLRKGLYGEGPFDWLADELEPTITMIHPFSVEGEDDNNDLLFDADAFQEVVDTIVSLIPETDSVPIDVILSLTNLDYIVSGSYKTLSFLDTEERIFEWDYKKGIIEYQPEEVTFYISVPKETDKCQAPFRTVFYQHANIRNRLDSVILADKLAEQCLATIGIDAAEHGPETYISGAFYILESLGDLDVGHLPDQIEIVLVKLILAMFYPSINTQGMTASELVDVLKKDTFLGTMLHGRAVDVKEQGILISGQTFWTADIYRTVDITRQTIFDLFQGIRVINSLCEDRDGNGHLDMLEGDFNQDGVCDLGGKDNDIYFMGMSLGTLLGIPFVTLEPEIETAVFNVPGGGLTDILMRTTVPNVNSAIRAELTGPVIVGRLDPATKRVDLTINKDTPNMAFADVVFEPGARVVLQNLDGGFVEDTVMDENGNFAVAVAADKGDFMHLKVVDPTTNEILDEVEWPSRVLGFGVSRNTPEARSFIDTAQWVVTLTDPIGYAPHLFLDPLPGNTEKNFLIQVCSPDAAVPLAHGAALARAAGVMDEVHLDHLLKSNALNWDRISFSQANLPLQSTSKRGWRVHPAYNHEYLLAPRYDPYSIMYSVVARRQAALFLSSNGQIIEDNIHLLVEEQYIADPIDPDYLE
jgi:hypothetical protein